MIKRINEIRIQSFNPYEARFLNRNVISRETLHLIKYLRSKNIKVVIEPNDDNEINFLTEKGIREFILDPINVILINIPLSIIVGLITSYLYDRFKRKPKTDEVNIFIEFNEKRNKVHYSHSGQPISDSKFKDLIKLFKERVNVYNSSFEITPPDDSRPFPIFLGHTGKLIGWAQIYEDNFGLKVEDAKITDMTTLERIQNEELKGFSIGGLVRKSKCSICKLDYLKCNHITGRTYNGKKCICYIEEIDLAEVSVVKDPINPIATIMEKSRKEKNNL